MSCVKPDLAGFVEAHGRLRTELGEDVVLLGEVLMQFPPDTPIDEQTGRPYDPMLEPTASAQASAAVRAGVTFKPVNRAGVGGDSGVSPAGWFEESHIMLDVPIAAASAAAGKVDFIARGERYKITSTKPDALGGPIDRLLIFGRRHGL